MRFGLLGPALSAGAASSLQRQREWGAGWERLLWVCRPMLRVAVLLPPRRLAATSAGLLTTMPPH